MLNLEHKPLISYPTVLDALHRMIRFHAPKQPSELEHLCLVDHFLENPHLPASPHLREYALAQVLIIQIVQAINSYRLAYRFPLIRPDEDGEQVEAAITRDGQTGQAELVAWDWLYYAFVQVNLQPQQTTFARWTNITTRTLRRYQEYAVRRLTWQLIEDEWRARHLEAERQAWRKPILPPREDDEAVE